MMTPLSVRSTPKDVTEKSVQVHPHRLDDFQSPMPSTSMLSLSLSSSPLSLDDILPTYTTSNPYRRCYHPHDRFTRSTFSRSGAEFWSMMNYTRMLARTVRYKCIIVGRSIINSKAFIHQIAVTLVGKTQ